MVVKTKIPSEGKYNQLTVLNEVEPRVVNKKTTRMMMCQCDCGNIGNYTLSGLRNGESNS